MFNTQILKLLMISLLIGICSMPTLANPSNLCKNNTQAVSKVEKRKQTSLTIISYKEGAFGNLVQKIGINYGFCFLAYSNSVLMYEEEYYGYKQPWSHTKDVSKNKFFKILTRMADDGFMIDLYIFADGSNNSIDFDGFSITDSDIRNNLNTGKYAGGKFPLRMVYQSNSYGNTLNDDWLSVGAKVTVGSRYVNFHSLRFNSFGRKWHDAKTVFRTAIKSSDTLVGRKATESAILAHANTKTNYEPCISRFTVLSLLPCAKSYFTKNWLPHANWQEGQSGKDNMVYSSFMQVQGDRGLTFFSEPAW